MGNTESYAASASSGFRGAYLAESLIQLVRLGGPSTEAAGSHLRHFCRDLVLNYGIPINNTIESNTAFPSNGDADHYGLWSGWGILEL